ncbi:nuclease-related domain-containing protein [Snodgrassella communis]|uniref:nuclease-related domain-containing protein n=1 Tax=Snodgrassella communis TaxID=2946699 RepID=UPI000C1E7ECA|nr:nuclease-related domain-containing protein [Snodgrassella communis]
MIDSKKWIEICSEGLTIHEVNAIIRIEQNFIDDEKKSSLTVKCKDFKTLYQQTNSIFPWKGYAGFRLADRKNAYEFDLLIFTHCSILVIELKDWHGKISNTNGRWCLNNRDMGKSPVTVTRNKAYLIMDKLQEINKKYLNI